MLIIICLLIVIFIMYIASWIEQIRNISNLPPSSDEMYECERKIGCRYHKGRNTIFSIGKVTLYRMNHYTDMSSAIRLCRVIHNRNLHYVLRSNGYYIPELIERKPRCTKNPKKPSKNNRFEVSIRYRDGDNYGLIPYDDIIREIFHKLVYMRYPSDNINNMIERLLHQYRSISLNDRSFYLLY